LLLIKLSLNKVGNQWKQRKGSEYMEDSVAEEVEAMKQKEEKKDTTIQIVKLEYVEEADDEEDTKCKNPQDTNPIPG
jgi:hypothetical protein